MEALGNPSSDFWRGKRILLTGHTGFKGSWLHYWLNELGAQTAGLSFSGYPKTVLGSSSIPTSLEIDADISTRSWQSQVYDYAPEIVFHLAAQSLVYTGFQDPKTTFETNVVGSLHLLEILESTPSIRVMVVITTDKVYRIEKGNPPRIESDPIGGNDPYSASKGAVELIVRGWPITSKQSLATARSGNVIGGGDDAPKRLIPDLVRAWVEERSISLRSPSGIRPWLHVLEPLRGYLLLAESLYSAPGSRGAYNFAPQISDQVRVDAIAQRAFEFLPPRKGFAINQVTESEFPETPELLLNATKARDELHWQPIWDWTTAVDKSLNWYQQFHEGVSAEKLFKDDIHSYIKELGN